jgi:hypothetical protein
MDGWCILGISASYTWFRGIVSLRTHTHDSFAARYIAAAVAQFNLFVRQFQSSLAPRRGPQNLYLCAAAAQNLNFAQKETLWGDQQQNLFFYLKSQFFHHTQIRSLF